MSCASVFLVEPHGVFAAQSVHGGGDANLLICADGQGEFCFVGRGKYLATEQVDVVCHEAVGIDSQTFFLLNVWGGVYGA